MHQVHAVGIEVREHGHLDGHIRIGGPMLVALNDHEVSDREILCAEDAIHFDANKTQPKGSNS